MRRRFTVGIPAGAAILLTLGASCLSQDAPLRVAAPADETATPVLYQDKAHESPVRGAPGDLLLLPGTGFEPDAIVVLQQVVDTMQPPTLPLSGLPTTTLTPLHVDAHAVTVLLPQSFVDGQAYAVWVENPQMSGSPTVSTPILINDARPMWMSPGPSSGSPTMPYIYYWGVPRPGFDSSTVTIVGRNLDPRPGLPATQVAFVPPSTSPPGSYVYAAEPPALPPGDTVASRAANGFYEAKVTEVTLPPGQYEVYVSRDGTSWVPVQDPESAPPAPTLLSVIPAVPILPDDSSSMSPCGPQPVSTGSGTAYTCVTLEQFADSMGSPTTSCGGQACTCVAGDAVDDTPCIARALAFMEAQGVPGTIYFTPGTWLVDAPCADGGVGAPDRYPTSAPGPAPSEYTKACSGGWSPAAGTFHVPQGINLVGAPLGGAEGSITWASVVSTGAVWDASLVSVVGGKSGRCGSFANLFQLSGQNVVTNLRITDGGYASSGQTLACTGSSAPNPNPNPILIPLLVTGNDVTITANYFDTTYEGVLVAGSAPLPDSGLGASLLGSFDEVITNNSFGVHYAGIMHGSPVEDSVIAGNNFFAGNDGSALGEYTARHLAVTSNTVDGAAQGGYAGDATSDVGSNGPGFNFGSPTANVGVLIAENTLRCVADTNHEGAIAFDDTGGVNGFTASEPATLVSTSTSDTVVSVSLTAGTGLWCPPITSPTCASGAGGGDAGSDGPASCAGGTPTCEMGTLSCPPGTGTALCSGGTAICTTSTCCSSLCASNFVGNWLSVVAGPGLGQTRRITAVTFDSTTSSYDLTVAPPLDVPPATGTEIVVRDRYWQVAVANNLIDNSPSVTSHTTSSPMPSSGITTLSSCPAPIYGAGAVGLFGELADSSVDSNVMTDTAGIYVDALMLGTTTGIHLTYFDDLRSNVIAGFPGGAPPTSTSPWIAGGGIELDGDVESVDNSDNVPAFGISVGDNTISGTAFMGLGNSEQDNFITAVMIGSNGDGGDAQTTAVPAYLDTLVFGNDISGMPPAGIYIDAANAQTPMLQIAISNGFTHSGQTTGYDLSSGLPTENDDAYSTPWGTVLAGNRVQIDRGNPHNLAVDDFVAPGEASSAQLVVAGCVQPNPVNPLFYDILYGSTAAPASGVDLLGPMIGCGPAISGGPIVGVQFGSVYFNASACGVGFSPCTPELWEQYRGASVPTNDYWTSALLGSAGPPEESCSALLSPYFSGASICGTNPMRICTPSPVACPGTGSDCDYFGNSCAWSQCSLDHGGPDYFGGFDPSITPDGCGSEPGTAGVLCCPN